MHKWKQRNGTKATYSRLIKIFERAGYKTYADAVKRTAQLSESESEESSGSGEEHSKLEQPDAYPPYQQKKSLRHLTPAKPKSSETYMIMHDKNLPEGKG